MYVITILRITSVFSILINLIVGLHVWHETGATIIFRLTSAYTPCPEKRGQSILGITLTNLDAVS